MAKIHHKITVLRRTLLVGLISAFCAASASAGAITVTSPNGGETWEMSTPTHASTVYITWTADKALVGANVQIDLYKAGLYYRTIAAMWSTDSGSFPFTVPSGYAVASDYKVRVKSRTNGDYYDYSDGNFSIVDQPPFIEVTAPNGGESWNQGLTYTIRWNSWHVNSDVRIELYKSGVLKQTISSGTYSGGSYSWTIPESVGTGNDYKIKITSTSDTTLYDWSDGYFTINPVSPKITVESPNGGEVWQRLTTHTIRWTSAGAVGSYVKIELNIDSVYRTIEASTPNDGSYDWLIPNDLVSDNGYRIKISSTSNPSYYDWSDAYFTIDDPPAVIIVASPNGGETWQPTQRYTIRWTYNNVPENVKIQLYKGGSFLRDIAPSTTCDGSYDWTVPSDLSGNDFRVRVVSTTRSSIYDLSDQDFTIGALVDADLSNVYVTPNPVCLGQTLTVYYTLTNTGTASHTFTVGGEIWDSGYRGTLPTRQHALSVGQAVSSTLTCTILTSWPPGNYEVRLRVWSSSGELLDEEPPPQFKIIDCSTHAVSTPRTPTGGPVGGSGFSDTDYTFTTGGASCSLPGHSVQYRFDWDDETYSDWSTSTSASHKWSGTGGNFNIRAQARCSSDTSKESSWSVSLPIYIAPHVPEADLALRNLTVTRPGDIILRTFTACGFDIVNNGPGGLSSEELLVSYYLSDDTTFGDADDRTIGDTSHTISLGSGEATHIDLNEEELTNMYRYWVEGLVPSGSYYAYARVRILDGSPLDSKSSNNYDRTDSTFSYTAEEGAEIVAFNPPKGPFAAFSKVETSVGVKNTGGGPASFWVGLSFAHETATNAGWPAGWQDVAPVQTEVLRPGQETTVTFEHVLLEGVCGQYYAASAVWADYDIQTKLLAGKIDDTRNYDLWRDKETGMKSLFWLPWNAVCISDIAVNRVPARTSERAFGLPNFVGFDLEPEVSGRPFLASGQHVDVLVAVTNNTQEEFDGALNATQATTAFGRRAVSLKPGETKHCALQPVWEKISGDPEKDPEGTWKATVVLERGTSVLSYESIDDRSVELQVVDDREDTATGPGITGICAPLPVYPDEASVFLYLYETGKLVLKTIANVSGPVSPYMDYQRDLQRIGEAVRHTGRVTLDDDGCLAMQRTLSVTWQNQYGDASVAFDACRIVAKMPPGTEVVSSGGGTVFSGEDQSVWIEWDVVECDKRILPGESGTFTFVITEPAQAIQVEAEMMLLLGPFQGVLGAPYTTFSDFPLVYNWKLWNTGGGYWCPIGWGRTTRQISPTERRL